MNMLAASLCLAGLAAGQTIADSASDFSREQGTKSWFYGYYDGDGEGEGDGAEPKGPYTDDDFERCTWHVDHWRGSKEWLRIQAGTQHPHAGEKMGNWIVRRWVSTVTGTIRMTGTVARNSGEDGTTRFRVRIDGTEIKAYVLGGDSKSASVDLTADVRHGTYVDFAVAPMGSQNNDSTAVRVKIALVSGTTRVPSTRRPDDRFYLKPGDTVLILGDALAADARFWFRIEDDIRSEYPVFKDPGSLRVVRAGAARETASAGSKRIGSVVSRHRPTVAILCYGAMDSLVDSKAYGSGVRALALRLMASGVDVTILARPAPDTKTFPELATHRAALERYRAFGERVARTLGCRFADALSRAKDGWSWGDGLHPGPEGHRAIAEAIEEAWGFGKALSDTD